MSNTRKPRINITKKAILERTAREGWYKANLTIARQRDIVTVLLIASLIGNILLVVL